MLGDALGSLATPTEVAEVGERWARLHSQQPPTPDAGPPTTLERVVSLLDDLGFAPEAADDGRTVALHRCAYYQLAIEQPQVVCALHLGMVRGAMGDRADDVRLGLTPVLDGSAPCLLHIRPRVPTHDPRTDPEEHPS